MSVLGFLFFSGLVACALYAVLPNLQETPAATPPSPLPLPETRYRLLQVPLSLFIKTFGTPVSQPPANVMRAFHRGATLVAISEKETTRRVTWQL